MKKFIAFILFAIICVMGASAQDEGLVFKGVPIGGELSSFISKLKSKDFTLIEKDGSKALLTGKFTGQNVKLLVMSTDSDKMVYGLGAIFDEVDTWQTILSQYENYKDLYTEKYGEPEQCIETYGNSVYSANSQINHIGLESGEIVYKSVFMTEKGSIIINIANGQSYSSFNLTILYRNEDNIKAYREAMKDEI